MTVALGIIANGEKEERSGTSAENIARTVKFDVKPNRKGNHFLIAYILKKKTYTR